MRRGDVEGALARARAVVADPAGLAGQDLADCFLTMARAQRTAGRQQEAEAAYRRAAGLYGEAGAYRRSSEAWRELSELLSERDQPPRPG